MRFDQANIKGGGDSQNASGIDPRTITSVFEPELAQGPPDAFAKLRDDQVLADDGWAKGHGFKLGDTIQVTTPKGTKVDYELAGTYDNKLDVLGKIVVTNASMTKDWNQPDDNFILVGGRGSPDTLERAAKQALADFPVAKAQTLAQFKDESADQVNQLLGLVFGAAGAVGDRRAARDRQHARAGRPRADARARPAARGRHEQAPGPPDGPGGVGDHRADRRRARARARHRVRGRSSRGRWQADGFVLTFPIVTLVARDGPGGDRRRDRGDPAGAPGVEGRRAARRDDRVSRRVATPHGPARAHLHPVDGAAGAARARPRGGRRRDRARPRDRDEGRERGRRRRRARRAALPRRRAAARPRRANQLDAAWLAVVDALPRRRAAAVRRALVGRARRVPDRGGDRRDRRPLPGLPRPSARAAGEDAAGRARRRRGAGARRAGRARPVRDAARGAGPHGRGRRRRPRAQDGPRGAGRGDERLARRRAAG